MVQASTKSWKLLRLFSSPTFTTISMWGRFAYCGSGAHSLTDCVHNTCLAQEVLPGTSSQAPVFRIPSSPCVSSCPESRGECLHRSAYDTTSPMSEEGCGLRRIWIRLYGKATKCAVFHTEHFEARLMTGWVHLWTSLVRPFGLAS